MSQRAPRELHDETRQVHNHQNLSPTREDAIYNARGYGAMCKAGWAAHLVLPPLCNHRGADVSADWHQNLVALIYPTYLCTPLL